MRYCWNSHEHTQTLQLCSQRWGLGLALEAYIAQEHTQADTWSSHLAHSPNDLGRSPSQSHCENQGAETLLRPGLRAQRRRKNLMTWLLSQGNTQRKPLKTSCPGPSCPRRLWLKQSKMRSQLGGIATLLAHFIENLVSQGVWFHCTTSSELENQLVHCCMGLITLQKPNVDPNQ